MLTSGKLITKNMKMISYFHISSGEKYLLEIKMLHLHFKMGFNSTVLKFSKSTQKPVGKF